MATAVILAAGRGVRFKSARPKILHDILGTPILHWVAEAAYQSTHVDQVVIVTGPDTKPYQDAIGDLNVIFGIQDPPRGTGDALRCGLEDLDSPPEEVVVLNGDTPGLTPETIDQLIEARRNSGAALCFTTVHLEKPTGYGRIVRDSDGNVERIVEEPDADEETKRITEVNAGLYAISGTLGTRTVADILANLGFDNAQNEVYLTDLIENFLSGGAAVAAFEAPDPDEILGINDRIDMARVAGCLRHRINEHHMRNGVTIENPATTTIEHNVEIGQDTIIHPCTVIRSGVRIGSNCSVGPFSHVRVGTDMAEGSEIGNFTETKKAIIGKGTKAKHLSYLGDVRIGDAVNIGAGTIFANYDGKTKHTTIVEDGAFIGSGTVLVAPCTVGKKAVTGAGSVVTRERNVGDGEVWVGVPARPLKRES